ncbi:helix-turn-helix domain-containing protein (plasmid) [Nocardia sp. CA-151230]|uniref:helix-turn-helix domain-containing protein n=1 Tax=Nocardia sp. CA-151230 TaxID=3239982 RepID=UPI003D8F1DE7
MRFKLRRDRSKKTDKALAKALANAEFRLKDDLIAARNEAGLDQKDIAELIGVDKSTISRFERLDSNPTLSMIRNYAYAIGALVSYKVEPFEEPAPAARMVQLFPGVAGYMLVESDDLLGKLIAPHGPGLLAEILEASTPRSFTAVRRTASFEIEGPVRA